MPFTRAQMEAIQARNERLLVCAAAGSGKTAVLIERIMGMLQSGEMDVDQMLVVTFTRAAASEMRERLETKLMESVGEDARLRVQLDKLAGAQIGTLHSFCQQIAREYFQAVDIDPQASVSDEVQLNNLLMDCLSDALERSYQQARDGDEELAALTQKFSDREMEEMILSLYRFLLSQAQPFEWLDEMLAKPVTENEVAHGPIGSAVRSDCGVLLDGAKSMLAQAEALTGLPDCREGYQKNVMADRVEIDRLMDALKAGLDELMSAMRTCSFGRLATYRLTESGEIAIRDQLKAIRERYKALVESARKALPDSLSGAVKDMQAMTPAIRGLGKVVKMLDTLFTAQKRERGMLDFNDLEHMTLKILSQDKMCQKVRRRFKAVFVDEYQDISGIQEAILNAVVGPTQEGPSEFMVGDVKQSIYRFRLADPTLFLQKQAIYEENPKARERKIILNQNFRSRENILASVNAVFERVMSHNVTEIEYDDDARLYPGIPSRDDPETQLHVFSAEGTRAANRPQNEAKALADAIRRLVDTPKGDGSPYRFSDIAVLLPVGKGVSDLVEQTLTEENIPVYNEDSKGSMDAPEVEQALCHLRLLSNEQDDLALLTALRGPVWQMTEQELCDVRLCKPDVKSSFLSALQAACIKGESKLSERCQKLISALERERFLQSSGSVASYLWDYLQRSGMYGFYGAQPGGKLRQANLRMLCYQAAEFEKSGGGLADFLSSVTARGNIKDSRSPAILSPWENVVRVMTIHKSKGLQFPAVFIMGLGDALHKRTQMGPLSMHPQLGVCLKYVNEHMRTKRDTLHASAIAMRKRAEEKAERARVLYVAMTRAQERLFLLGTLSKTDFWDYAKEMENDQKDVVGAELETWEAGSMMEWLCQAARSAEKTDRDSIDDLWEKGVQIHFPTKSTSFPQKKAEWRVVFHSPVRDVENFSEMETVISANRMEKRLVATSMEVERPSTLLLELPQYSHGPLKAGVTALCRQLSGSELEETAELKRIPIALARPRLLSDEPEQPAYLRAEGDQMGIQIGSATHKALSILPLSETMTDHKALTRTLDQLCTQGKLTREERERLLVPSILRFTRSELWKRMLLSTEIRREWGFNFRMAELCEGIVQGVIDLCFLEQDEWILVDYKTDRVHQAGDLWQSYGRQISVYRRALEECTGKRVREAWLYSLSLGEAAMG